MCCVSVSFLYLNISSETAHWILSKLYQNDPLVVPYQICLKVIICCISRSQGQQIGFHFFSCLKPQWIAFILGIKHHLEGLYHSCLNYDPCVKNDHTLVVTTLH